MNRPEYSRALVYSGTPGLMELTRIAIPPLRPDEALVRIDGCTLCGSDLHSLHGRRQIPVPTILGHEIVGTVVEIGSRFPRVDMQQLSINIGDRVTWAIVANCGSCFYCQRGLEQKCEAACKYGHMGFGSGLALSACPGNSCSQSALQLTIGNHYASKLLYGNSDGGYERFNQSVWGR